MSPLVSPGTRSFAYVLIATSLPSAEIEDTTAKRSFGGCNGPVAIVQHSVVPAWRSRTYTLGMPPHAPATRFVATLVKTTHAPASDIDPSMLWSFASMPAVSTLTRSVVAPWRLRTNTSHVAFVSDGTRLVAKLVNATHPAVEGIQHSALSSSP